MDKERKIQEIIKGIKVLDIDNTDLITIIDFKYYDFNQDRVLTGNIDNGETSYYIIVSEKLDQDYIKENGISMIAYCLGEKEKSNGIDAISDFLNTDRSTFSNSSKDDFLFQLMAFSEAKFYFSNGAEFIARY